MTKPDVNAHLAVVKRCSSAAILPHPVSMAYDVLMNGRQAVRAGVAIYAGGL